MALRHITSAFLLASSLFFQDIASTILFDYEACTADTVGVHGGVMKFRGVRRYIVKCSDGFVPPLVTAVQHDTNRCANSSLKAKLPQACVAERYAYRKIKFQLWYQEKSSSDTLCEDTSKIFALEQLHNSTVQFPTVPNGREKQHKIVISNCLRPNSTSGYSIIHAVVTDVEKRNITTNYVYGSYATSAVLGYQKLVEAMKSLGYIDQENADTVHMVYTYAYNESDNIVGYHCDDHLVLRVVNGHHVCVGCGKGFWMDITSRTCHPCGPGFYGPEETAVSCLPCPVQYKSGPWTASTIEKCFESEYYSHSLTRLAEVLLVPALYMVVLVLVVFVLSKYSVVPIDEPSFKKKH